jgi:hypothetical protein
MRWLVAVMLVALPAIGACRGDPQRCEQACRNFGTLVYWKPADAEVAAAPPEQRDALRKQKLGELSTRLERHIDICVSQCTSTDDPTTVDCMIAAKTAEQALACMK